MMNDRRELFITEARPWLLSGGRTLDHGLILDMAWRHSVGQQVSEVTADRVRLTRAGEDALRTWVAWFRRRETTRRPA
jgi:hypothetical protein